MKPYSGCASLLWEQPVRMLLPLFLLFRHALCIQLFNSTTIPSSVSDGCASALTQDITGCSQLPSVAYIANQRYIDSSTLGSLCSSSCFNSLSSYHSTVDAECGNTDYEFAGNISQTIPSVVDPLVVRTTLIFPLNVFATYPWMAAPISMFSC
jgi:hypothetical protein